MKTKWKKRLPLIIIVLIVCMVYLHYENTTLQITTYSLLDENIPKEFDNYKIVQISDVHNTKSKKLITDLVEAVKEQQPNIIVLTGDLIDASRTDIQAAVNLVEQLQTIAQVYFVSGNHEASIENYSELKKQLKEKQVVVLDNKAETLQIGDETIQLIGLDDPSMVYDPYVPEKSILLGHLENMNYDNNQYCILLSHRPELYDTYIEMGMNLVLSGHAHGGQIRIPFLGGVIAPNQRLFPKYTSGMFQTGKTTMVVSRGIGNSILPFRINNRPELIVVELKQSSPKAKAKLTITRKNKRKAKGLIKKINHLAFLFMFYQQQNLLQLGKHPWFAWLFLFYAQM